MLPGHSAYWTWQAMQFAWAHLLADKRYLARVPLIASRRIARNPRQRQANKALRSLLNANKTLHRIPQSVCICPLYGVSDVFYHLLYVRVAFYQKGKSWSFVVKEIWIADFHGECREMNPPVYLILKATCVFSSKTYLLLTSVIQRNCLGPFHYYTTCVQVELDH